MKEKVGEALLEIWDDYCDETGTWDGNGNRTINDTLVPFISWLKSKFKTP